MHSVAWWPTVVVLAIATFTDLRSRRIPNWLVLPFLLGGVCVSLWMGGWAGIGHSFGGIVVGGALFGVISLLGGMGMGDVKLCAAIGAWVGPSQMLTALVVTGIAGGVIALCWAIAGGFLFQLLTRTGNLLAGFTERGIVPDPDYLLENPLTRKMPYAPAIAVGTLFSFFAQTH